MVDDRPENLFSLEIILSNLNYICVKANSGEAALNILGKDADFAIILMDVQMPIMDGYETVERIRLIETIKHVPIIFLTASMDSSVHIFKGYQTGAVDFMIKPLSTEILRAKVAVFVDLYKKTQELLIQKEDMVILNKGLAIRNEEKEKIAAELNEANKALALQILEKEKRTTELTNANKELTAFNYVSSHDLQEPLNKIQTFSNILLDEETENLSDQGKYNLGRMLLSVKRMQQLISDLLAFSKVNATERKFETVDLKVIIEDAKTQLADILSEKQATIKVHVATPVNVVTFQFRQLMYNLISNALKFARTDTNPMITITCKPAEKSDIRPEKLLAGKDYCHISVQDNGIGFEPQYGERIFEVFQRLHSKDVYPGTGIGLAIVKKIIENHEGFISATGVLNKGAEFNIYIPAN